MPASEEHKKIPGWVSFLSTAIVAPFAVFTAYPIFSLYTWTQKEGLHKKLREFFLYAREKYPTDKFPLRRALYHGAARFTLTAFPGKLSFYALPFLVETQYPNDSSLYLAASAVGSVLQALIVYEPRMYQLHDNTQFYRNRYQTGVLRRAFIPWLQLFLFANCLTLFLVRQAKQFFQIDQDSLLHQKLLAT